MKKNLLIFGASSDIGRSIVEEFGEDYSIYATYFSNKERIPKRVERCFRCDIREDNDIDTLFKSVPQLDLIVTSCFPYHSSKGTDFKGYLEVEPYLRGHMNIISLIPSKVKRGGKLINILGQCAENGLPEGAHYAAAFAAIHNLGKSLNSKEGRQGVFSIHDLLVGAVNTRIWEDVPSEVFARYRERSQNFLNPEEVARYVKQIAESKIGPTKILIDGFYSLP